MTIRTFQTGDDEAQVAIFNEAAAHLPKFKPATLIEVRRRCKARDFDPGTRFYAFEGNQPVGYATFQGNGRVSFPWCRKGHEAVAKPLFESVLRAVKSRGMSKIFAAYREDWKEVQDYFQAQGFQKARDMVNFVLDAMDQPTQAARRASTVTPFRPEDLPQLLKLGAGVLRTTTLPELEQHLFHNPYFSADALFAVRAKADALPQGVGIVITDATYANPRQVDAAMPCFRLGAFGTEGTTTKRINGLFSLVAESADVNRLGLDLLSHGSQLLQQADLESFAAQVPSDAPHLLRFYQHHFRRQGSFPVLEKTV
jgi:hypothetical protein